MSKSNQKDWTAVKELSSDEILQVLPHRYPFLMVDRVLEIKTSRPVRVGMAEKEVLAAQMGSYAVTIKNVALNESVFQGHFPGNPVFPGALTLEAMAQSAAFVTVPFLAALNGGKLPRLKVALAGFDRVRFRKPILPGDQMKIRVTATQVRGGIWVFEGEVAVLDKIAANGKFLAQLGESR